MSLPSWARWNPVAALGNVRYRDFWKGYSMLVLDLAVRIADSDTAVRAYARH